MTALGVRLKVVANAGLEIEPRRDGAAPERLHFNLLRTLVEVPFALRLEPELIDIAAVPALSVPEIAVLTVADPRLQLIHHEPPGSALALVGTQILATGGPLGILETGVIGVAVTGQIGRWMHNLQTVRESCRERMCQDV